MPRIALASGHSAPSFTQKTLTSDRFTFDTIAGRYLVLCFYRSAAEPQAQAALDTLHAASDLFDDKFASCFGVTSDEGDVAASRIAHRIPGYRHFIDAGLIAHMQYGLSADEGQGPTRTAIFVIDPTMRIVDRFALADAAEAVALLRRLPPPGRHAGFEVQAPILVLPNVFDAELCETLIARYDSAGGELSGFMREVAGKTVGMQDTSFKVRRDVMIEEPDLVRRLQERILRTVVPEIAKVHQYRVTRMERYLVACYDATEGGHFRAHRDNTTPGTAHRRFAVSVNLNDDFDGGEVSFPEYGTRGFKAPAGGAVVFSCSLLHAVSRVTAGRRYAFLPFLYDDAAAALRARNASTVVDAADDPLRQPES